jgi:hypothetical protein
VNTNVGACLADCLGDNQGSLCGFLASQNPEWCNAVCGMILAL